MDLTGLDLQLSDLAWCIATGLRAGYDLRDVFDQLAAGAPEPSAGLCRRLVTEMAAGLDAANALAKIQVETSSPPLKRLLDVFLRHRISGSQLPDLLDVLTASALRQAGSDPAFYAFMREEAQSLGAKLPQRALVGG